MSARAETFFDTSALLYATDPTDSRSAVAVTAFAVGGITSVQVLCEFTTIVRTRLGCSWLSVHEALGIFGALCPKPLPIRLATYELALELVQQEVLSLSDAMVAASAIGGGCLYLLTDMAAHGRVLGDRVTIFNPFAVCNAQAVCRRTPTRRLSTPDTCGVSEKG